MNWQKITRICYTYAIPDGAWIEDSTGARAWSHQSELARKLGEQWLREQIRRMGTFTGIWYDVA